MDRDAQHALIRFGLGPRPDEAPPADPRAWLHEQLADPDPALAVAGMSVTQALALESDSRRNPPPPGTPSPAHVAFETEWRATADQRIDTSAPFRERLVWFWANHFAISLARVPHLVAGSYLREAIRPNVTGRFVDMLFAVMTHPAMLIYLDNLGSVGPHSPEGLRGHGGLNENLARECLELHTLGVRAGYSQSDVTAMAAILTGWTARPDGPSPGFVFAEHRHEPGPKTIMGQTFPPGMAGGVTALTWLAGHPATQAHLATKLVRHFVADEPPASCVAQVTAVLRDTDGDLAAAARAIIALPQAWQPLRKLRDPQDWIIAAVRALGLQGAARAGLVHWIEALGEASLAPPLPNGWPDTAAAWAGGELLLRRTDLAWSITGPVQDRDPDAVLQAILGPLASDRTRRAVRSAGSRREALTLLLSSPEFFRR